MDNAPLVSCVCVTRNKVSLISRAVECFRSQTYSNKELIIIYEDNCPEIKEYVESLEDTNIITKEVATNPKLSLGQLRNLSIEFSNGFYFCQWDADDWYHNKRIELQYHYLQISHKPVCFLTYWIFFDTLTKQAFFSRKRLWEGSILCEKSVWSKIKYPNLPKLEDYRFVESLMSQDCIYPIDLPFLYIYTYHGDNTWDYDHFMGNYIEGRELTKKASVAIDDILQGRSCNKAASEILSSEQIVKNIRYDCNL